MLKKIWRTSHLSLALISSLFIIIASLTGGLLALEPIINYSSKEYQNNLDTTSISDFIISKNKNQIEISSLENKNNKLVASFDEGTFFVDKQANKISKTKKRLFFFRFLTKLHRSLFYKTTGRALIGIVAFLLFLITTSGIALILIRQKGYFFKKIINDKSHQFYHTYLGRLLLIPILAISMTGTYLSMKRFKLINETKHTLDFSKKTSNDNKINQKDFNIFKNTSLSDLKSLEFPFSDDPEEFFILKLNNKEFLINQFNGTIVDKINYSNNIILKNISFDLHTGYYGIIWAIIILFSSFSLLYFVYSGFVIAYQRFKIKLKNKYQKDEAEFIILYGTENGSTKNYAKMLFEGMLKTKLKVYVDELNSFTEYKNIKQLIVLTSTYGIGQAPTNATNFINKLKNTKQNKFDYTVVGFGSLSYKEFCKFAKDVHTELNNYANPILNLHTVNNRSFEQFKHWMELWNKKMKLSVKVDKNIVSKRKKTTEFELINKYEAPDESTILLRFESKEKFSSGDLIGIYANTTSHERLYSIAEIDNQILLSVKIHENGLCSNYLKNLLVGHKIKGFISINKDFHFPKKSDTVTMIATGTGIAPFLGMIKSHSERDNISLYFGITNKKSLNPYLTIIDNNLEDNKTHIAFSRENTKKTYVQDLISRDIKEIINKLNNGGTIMICGSIKMQNAVLQIIENNLGENDKKTISYFKNQILVDCY